MCSSIRELARRLQIGTRRADDVSLEESQARGTLGRQEGVVAREMPKTFRDGAQRVQPPERLLSGCFNKLMEALDFLDCFRFNL